VKLAVTIDVEEEGLFSGRYESRDAAVKNVGELLRLDRIFKAWGIRPTLLITYQAARHGPYHELLMGLKERWRGEIGAHLHPWNTPPLEPLPYPEPVPSECIPSELLSAKLRSLLDSIEAMGTVPVSFRMGRFNMGPRMFTILEESGVRVDSSIAPMHKYYGGPDHLSAPADPYFPDPTNPCAPGASKILEVPMTILPLTRRLGEFLDRIENTGLLPRPWIPWFARNLASLPAQPFWTGPMRLKAAVRLHRARGGKVLSIFFHSSELMAGGSPVSPTNENIEALLAKLNSLLEWLTVEINAESCTLSELYDFYGKSSSHSVKAGHGDS